MTATPKITQKGVGALATLSPDPPSSLNLPEGTLIAGKYRIERKLGVGAMGVVYGARHTGLDELVAIKCMHPNMQRVPGALQRFAREAKACVRIKSDHVANVLDVDVAPGLGPYIVMEYLEGEDLGALSAREGPVATSRAAAWVLQACEALALAHSMQIVHRDIKPSNLFLTRRGELEVVKLLDFGISKAVITGNALGADLSLTQTTTMLGSPVYMSPEQIRADGSIDHRSDIWSLGVVLHELLTGRTAFMAESLTQVCARVLESPAPRLSTTNDRRFPKALEAVIDRCLAKNPDDRFPTVAELAAALAPFAPPGARLHADRAASITRGQDLRASGWFPGPSPSSAGAPARGGETVPRTEQEMVRDSTADGAEDWKPRRRGVGLALGAFLTVGAAVAFALIVNSKNPTTDIDATTDGRPPAESQLPTPQEAPSPTSDSVVASVASGPSVTETPVDVRPVPSNVSAAPKRATSPRPREVRRRPSADPAPKRPSSEVREAAPPDPSPAPPPVSPGSPVELLDDDDPVRLLE